MKNTLCIADAAEGNGARKQFRLGKLPVRHDARTLMLSKYLRVMPPIPPARDWTGKIPEWGMLANDTVGDCTCASAGHLEMLWTADSGVEFIPTDAQVLAMYSAITGYDPSQTDSDGNNPTDTGADELSVLKFWRKTGLDGRKIHAFASVNMGNQNEVRAAIAIFGAVYAGIQLPQSAMDATDAGEPWTDTKDKNILGGHAVPYVAYDENGFTCITWGQRQNMTVEWSKVYADEGFVILSPDWIAGSGFAPSGFNMSQLQADLAQL